jgi:triosephosphate isomerase
VRRPLIAANWKMHFRAGEPARYFRTFLVPAPDLSDRDAVFFVPAALLDESVEAVAGTALGVGGQNLHWEDQGAFTGETSGAMIAATGAAWCLVGHSERRNLFGEDDGAVARKLQAALRHGLEPVLCVGERLDERRGGRARATVLAQLENALEDLEEEDLRRITIAYEPVWAIGTGETATPQVASGMHAAIREVLREIADRDVARRVRILYGGSVTPDNIDELMREPEIDGVLVGGASLRPHSFRRILDFGRAEATPAA